MLTGESVERWILFFWFAKTVFQILWDAVNWNCLNFNQMPFKTLTLNRTLPSISFLFLPWIVARSMVAQLLSNIVWKKRKKIIWHSIIYPIFWTISFNYNCKIYRHSWVLNFCPKFNLFNKQWVNCLKKQPLKL